MSRVGFRVDALTATVDGRSGETVVDGWRPGPAGVASLGLLGGDATLVVDVAEPELLVALRLPEVASPAAVRVIETLLGDGVAERLRSVRADAPALEVWRRDRQLRRFGTGQGGLGLIGRLVVAAAEISAPGRSAAAIAVGLVEAGVAAVLVDREIHPSPSGISLVRAGVRHWEALPADAFDATSPVALARLVVEGSRWAATVDSLDAGLGAALRRLLLPLDGRSGAAAPAVAAGGAAPASSLDRLRPRAAAPEKFAAAMDEAAAERPETGRRGDVPVLVDPRLSAAADVRTIAAELDDHHLTVHIGGLGGTPAVWLRVFEVGPDERTTLLSLAPFAPSGRPWATAIALVPPRDAGSLRVDVTADPAGPWRSAATRATQHATALGVAAATAARRGRRDAPQRWRACSDAWDTIWDGRRSALALEYAEDPSPAGAPLLVDEL